MWPVKHKFNNSQRVDALEGILLSIRAEVSLLPPGEHKSRIQELCEQAYLPVRKKLKLSRVEKMRLEKAGAIKKDTIQRPCLICGEIIEQIAPWHMRCDTCRKKHKEEK